MKIIKIKPGGGGGRGMIGLEQNSTSRRRGCRVQEMVAQRGSTVLKINGGNKSRVYISVNNRSEKRIH